MLKLAENLAKTSREFIENWKIGDGENMSISYDFLEIDALEKTETLEAKLENLLEFLPDEFESYSVCESKKVVNFELNSLSLKEAFENQKKQTQAEMQAQNDEYFKSVKVS